MAKRNEFNSHKLVTILNIILLQVQYFFGDIFEKLGISCWDEFSFPEKKIMEIFTSELEIRFAPISRKKKHMNVITQKCFPKKVKKQQCCIYVGPRWKKLLLSSSSYSSGLICSKIESLGILKIFCTVFQHHQDYFRWFYMTLNFGHFSNFKNRSSPVWHEKIWVCELSTILGTILSG